MNVSDPRLLNSMGFHPRMSEKEVRKRAVVLRIAEQHYSAAEFSKLMADMANGLVDVRIYDDGIVLMREAVAFGGE